jgi:hypothetical protein
MEKFLFQIIFTVIISIEIAASFVQKIRICLNVLEFYQEIKFFGIFSRWFIMGKMNRI